MVFPDQVAQGDRRAAVQPGCQAHTDLARLRAMSAGRALASAVRFDRVDSRIAVAAFEAGWRTSATQRRRRRRRAQARTVGDVARHLVEHSQQVVEA